MNTVPVLICGGGPVGLSLSLALGQQGISHRLIEKHPGSTTHPKARGVNVRTMECFRNWGVEKTVRVHELSEKARRLLWMDRLQGKQVGEVRIEKTGFADSPSSSCLVTQDFVEQVLWAAVMAHPKCALQASVECVRFEQREDVVICECLDRNTNTTEQVRCQYLIAADGAHSQIRSALGIGMQGIESMGDYLSVYCKVALPPEFLRDPAAVTVFTDPAQQGKFIMAVDLKKRWIIAQRTADHVGRFDDAYCQQLVRGVTERSDLDVDIINTSVWQMAALNAERYRDKRVFLAGDAAHRTPPTGGMGMNIGIHDAHNLAWKLAYVLQGYASDELLDTYEQERQPIAAGTIEWSCRNADRLRNIVQIQNQDDPTAFEAALKLQKTQLNHRGLDLGFVYQSGAVYDKVPPIDPFDPDVYHPSATPGARAPHCEIAMAGQPCSTLDLFKDTFVCLLRAGCALESIRSKLPIPKQYPVVHYEHQKDFTDKHQDFIALYQMSTYQAVLVRPDGHIAWRM